MKSLRVLIADDEPLAREQLERLVVRHARLELVASVATGIEAIDQIDRVKPDVVFLDIRMPGATGIEVVQRIRHNPYVVFTTAYDEFAVTAFELQALDYLLKPFGPRRFDRAVDRLLHSEPMTYAKRLTDGLGGELIDRLLVRVGSGMKYVPVASILRVEAADDYAEIVTTDGARELVSVRMKALAARLDPARFVRVHRSTIVNIEHVVEINPAGNGRRTLLMSDGVHCTTSRTGAARLDEVRAPG